MFRAGLLGDEAIRRLVNRRFVPLYFDLDDGGAAADSAARAFVIAARPALGEGSVATPNALVMTPEGAVVAELDPYQAPETFLAELKAALRARPEFAQPSAAELGLSDPLQRATLALDLGELAEAQRLLAPLEGAAARYLAGHIARLRGDVEAMEREFARVEALAGTGDLRDDLLVERAQAAWRAGDFPRLTALTSAVSGSSTRATEAHYLRGLAAFHGGARAEALALWRTNVETHAEDAWVYRSDWAYTELQGGSGVLQFAAPGASKSLLGRIGYMGRANPDLRPR